MNADSVDFAKLVERVQKPKVGKNDVSIWGGECSVDTVLELAQGWLRQCKIPYRIWEFSNEIRFEDNNAPLPANAKLLERARLFGEGGDLNLRRDNNRFLWRFIGIPNVAPPQVGNPEDFWGGEAGAAFHQIDSERILLWGERQEGFEHWFDIRAAGANLKYPVAKTGLAQITYRTYSRAGRVEFVWFYKVEAYNG